MIADTDAVFISGRIADLDTTTDDSSVITQNVASTTEDNSVITQTVASTTENTKEENEDEEKGEEEYEEEEKEEEGIYYTLLHNNILRHQIKSKWV